MKIGAIKKILKNVVIFDFNKRQEVTAENLCKGFKTLLDVELTENDFSDVYPLGKDKTSFEISRRNLLCKIANNYKRITSRYHTIHHKNKKNKDEEIKSIRGTCFSSVKKFTRTVSLKKDTNCL